MSDCRCAVGDNDKGYGHSEYCPVWKDERIAELESEVSALKESNECNKALASSRLGFLNKATTTIDTLKESVRWIPVSERLPEPGINVLVWDWVFKRTVLAYIGKTTKTDWWGTGHTLSCPPKEWHPLPLPPVDQGKL